MNHNFRIKHVCYHIRRHPLLDHSLFRMHIISHNHIGIFGCAAISSCFLLSIWYCLSHNMCMGGFHAKVWKLLSTCRAQTETVFLANSSYKSNRLGIYKNKFQVVAPQFRIRKYPLTSPSARKLLQTTSLLVHLVHPTICSSINQTTSSSKPNRWEHGKNWWLVGQNLRGSLKNQGTQSKAALKCTHTGPLAGPAGSDGPFLLGPDHFSGAKLLVRERASLWKKWWSHQYLVWELGEFRSGYKYIGAFPDENSHKTQKY